MTVHGTVSIETRESEGTEQHRTVPKRSHGHTEEQRIYCAFSGQQSFHERRLFATCKTVV